MRACHLGNRDRFDTEREKFVADLIAMEQGTRQLFRPGLRVKKVQGTAGLFEMTWAPDGRAVFAMGEPIIEGKRSHRVAPRRQPQHPVSTPYGITAH